MADNYLITGYWGEPHVTAENDRGFNAAVFGVGKFVLPVGEMFRAEYIGNNTVRVYDGKLINNGALAGIPAGEYIDLLIPEAGQGMKRNDLIIFQYSQDASTLIESGVFVVLSGAETSGTAVDPALTESDLLTNTATFDQMALWRVPVSGTVISAPEQVFEVHGLTNVDNTPDTEKYVKYAQTAGEAQKVGSGLTVRFNGGRTENTDMWTYDGSTSRTVNITPDKIGAAPAGYGLGGVATRTENWDTAIDNGFYFGITNSPDGAWWYGYAVRDGEDPNRVTQTAYREGIICTRTGTVDSLPLWEYGNPPMVPGVEYRAAKRHNGKAVYEKVIEVNSLPANTYTDVWFADDATELVDLRVVAHSGEWEHVLPLFNDSGARIVYASRFNSRIRIYSMNTDSSGSSGTIYVSYTKG